MKKIMSLLLVVALISAMTVPVSADEGNAGGWIELLETTSVQLNGENWFSVNGNTGSFNLDLATEKRLCKIDMVVWHQTVERISSASITSGSTTQNLTVLYIGENQTRIYGAIPNAFYEDLNITINKSTTTNCTFELLSCKVTPLSTIDNPASGTLKRYYSDPNPLSLPANFTVDSVYESSGYEYLLIPVTITDWRKYDQVTLFGSISKAALNSFRASIGSKGLPYTITYMESIPTSESSWGYYSHEWFSSTETNYYDIEGNYSDIPAEFSKEDGFAAGDYDGYSVVSYGGSVLYTVTIDLTGIDRSISGNLECFFTCIADPQLGYAFNVQNATGSVLTADTTSVSWWVRFTTFMTDLFGGDTEKADQFQDDMQEANDALTDANEQLDAVTKPAVEDVPLDPSIYLDAEGTAQAGQIVQSLLGNELVLPMASITLIVGLAAFIIF